MVSTFTPNLDLELQGTGDNAGTWGSVLNLAALTVIDTVLGGVQSFALSNVNVTVTTTQSQNNAFILSGTLTGNVIITWPAIGRTIFVANNTTGNFTVTLARSGGGTTAVIAQGKNGFYVLASTGVIAPATAEVPTGTVIWFADDSVPTGYLEANGAAVSRTTYATLFTLIGTTYGSGDGATTFNLPDLRGYFVRGWDNGRGVDTGRVFGSNQVEMIGPHDHTFVGSPLSGHTHTFVIGDNGSSAGPHQGSGGYQGSEVTKNTGSTSGGTPAGTINNNSGTENRPVNIALFPCIKT